MNLSIEAWSSLLMLMFTIMILTTLSGSWFGAWPYNISIRRREFCHSFKLCLQSFAKQDPSTIPAILWFEHKWAIHAITGSKLHIRSWNVFGETKRIPPLVDFQSLRVFDICGGHSSRENKHVRNIGSFLSTEVFENSEWRNHIASWRYQKATELRDSWFTGQFS